MRGDMVSDSGNELVCNGMFNLLVHYLMVDLSMESLEVDSPRQVALRFWKDLNTSRLLTHTHSHTYSHTYTYTRSTLFLIRFTIIALPHIL
jgi:hypothetical protein